MSIRIFLNPSFHDPAWEQGRKWAESIGQALHYSIQTGKRAGVALILEKPGDYNYWICLNTIIDRFSLPSDTWLTSPPGGLDCQWATESHPEEP
jgi:hypothetical protein